MSSSPSITLPFLDPRDPVYLADPHRVLDALRSQSPFVADPIGLSLIDYAYCEASFHDPALSPGIDALLDHKGLGALWGNLDHTLTDSEGDTHKRLRRTVSPWFTARRIDALRERTRDLVDALLADRTDPTDGIEMMTEYAHIVPAALFCWMVGAPDSDADRLSVLSRALLSVFTAEPEMVEPVRAAKAELAEFTRALLAAKRTEPDDALASFLASAAAEGRITELDAFYLLEELLSAAVDNTANTAGAMVWALLGHPEQWARLHEEPELLTGAVEECGRYEPAIRHTIKVATADTQVLDLMIPAGTFVTVRIAAAHRDPAVYPDPHSLDIARPLPRPQLAFGAGRHYCLGAALGRMEVQELVGGLTRRWPAARAGQDVDMSMTAAGIIHRLPLELS